MNLFPKSISITGFLGSGKTTLLSEFVKNENVNDVAFIINEFGEVGLDHNLIESSDETVLELQNGCICCTIQEDLKLTLLNLLTKMQKGLIKKFNKVIIETHSEHFILRIQKLLRENKILPDLVAINYVYLDDEGKGSKIDNMILNKNGEFENKWRHGFFSERLKEI